MFKFKYYNVALATNRVVPLLNQVKMLLVKSWDATKMISSFCSISNEITTTEYKQLRAFFNMLKCSQQFEQAHFWQIITG